MAEAQILRDVPFAHLQRRLLARGRIPLQGTLETTYRCNLACAHCYVNQPAGSLEERARELPTERLLELIDEFVQEGCLELLLTGGEVLVRPDFPEVYLHAVNRGLLVTIFTNGTLVTDRIADLLDSRRPHKVEISLYGMTRETYERVTRVPGSYDKCLDGIRRLVERGVPLTLKTVALTWNHHEIPAMEAHARGLGLEFRFDSALNPRVDCGANRNGELQLSADQALELDLQNPERRRELKEFCEKFVPPAAAAAATGGSEYVYTCGAGETSFTVDPYGHLQMCQLSRRQSYDVAGEGRFADGWQTYFPALRARKWQGNSVCRRCSLISLCSSCPGAAEMETGDIEALVPGFCTITHARAFAAMGDVEHHRSDASCCLGGSGPGVADSSTSSGACGGGCDQPPAKAPGLIQIERRRPAATG
jgi:radical SAM protein with 4Fe4S-binding SPASM domain